MAAIDMPYHRPRFWLHSGWLALAWTPIVMLLLYVFVWSPLTIHAVRGLNLDNGYLLENTSSKSTIAIMTCRRKPDTVVVLEDTDGRRHVEADNSTGKGTGNGDERAWAHVNDWPEGLKPGPILGWKIITYHCLKLLGDGWLIQKAVETPKVILTKPGYAK